MTTLYTGEQVFIALLKEINAESIYKIFMVAERIDINHHQKA